MAFNKMFSIMKGSHAMSNLCVIQKYGLRQKAQSGKQMIDDMHRSMMSRNKAISSISEIPISFKASRLFGFCGFLSGLVLLYIPPTVDICVPFPNMNDANCSKKMIALFMACSTCNGYIGGKVYQYKTFKLGDSKRFYKVLGNLVNKTPFALIHCAGFTTIVFYGMFGIFNLFETVLYGEPYGLDSDNEKWKQSEYGNKRLLGHNKKISECSFDEIVMRTKFAMEITAHWTQSTIHIIFPIFLLSSSALIASNIKVWRSIYVRIKP